MVQSICSFLLIFGNKINRNNWDSSWVALRPFCEAFLKLWCVGGFILCFSMAENILILWLWLRESTKMSKKKTDSRRLHDRTLQGQRLEWLSRRKGKKIRASLCHRNRNRGLRAVYLESEFDCYTSFIGVLVCIFVSNSPQIFWDIVKTVHS